MAARKLSPKAQAKANASRFNLIYAKSCHGIQVSIWDMKKIWEVGMKSIEAGDDDVILGQKIRTFVDTLRLN
jgi:hypothetical protein